MSVQSCNSHLTSNKVDQSKTHPVGNAVHGREWIVEAHNNKNTAKTLKESVCKLKLTLLKLQDTNITKRSAILVNSINTFVLQIEPKNMQRQIDIKTFLFGKCGCTKNIEEFTKDATNFVKSGPYHFDKSLNKLLDKIEKDKLLKSNEKQALKVLKDKKVNLEKVETLIIENKNLIEDRKKAILNRIDNVLNSADLKLNSDNNLAQPSDISNYNTSRLQIIEKLNALKNAIALENTDHLSLNPLTSISNFSVSIDLGLSALFEKNLNGGVVYRLVEGTGDEKGLRELLNLRKELQKEAIELQKDLTALQKEKQEEQTQLIKVRPSLFAEVQKLSAKDNDEYKI